MYIIQKLSPTLWYVLCAQTARQIMRNMSVGKPSLLCTPRNKEVDKYIYKINIRYIYAIPFSTVIVTIATYENV